MQIFKLEKEKKLRKKGLWIVTQQRDKQGDPIPQARQRDKMGFTTI